MKYAPFFEIRLHHSYYTEGRCADFFLTPTLETTSLLNNHRCILKKQRDGVRVFIPLEENGQPFIPFSSEAVFVFRMVLQNEAFPYFTDLTDFNNKGLTLFTNEGLSDEADKNFSLPSKTVPPEKNHGPSDFARIVIASNASLPASSEAIENVSLFHIYFSAKKTKWSYYCVTDVNYPEASFKITDAAPEESSRLVFSEGNRTNLTTQDDPGDKVAKELKQQYPALKRIRFFSDNRVLCRERSKKHLELHAGELRLSESLPNPSFRNTAIRSIGEGDTPTEEMTLFHVVKFLTHSQS